MGSLTVFCKSGNAVTVTDWLLINCLFGQAGEVSYEDKLKFTSIIAQPMASKKLCKKVYKVRDKFCQIKIYILKLNLHVFNFLVDF